VSFTPATDLGRKFPNLFEAYHHRSSCDREFERDLAKGPPCRPWAYPFGCSRSSRTIGHVVCVDKSARRRYDRVQPVGRGEGRKRRFRIGGRVVTSAGRPLSTLTGIAAGDTNFSGFHKGAL
jgi:hypothetical protein